MQVDDRQTDRRDGQRDRQGGDLSPEIGLPDCRGWLGKSEISRADQQTELSVAGAATAVHKWSFSLRLCFDSLQWITVQKSSLRTIF